MSHNGSSIKSPAKSGSDPVAVLMDDVSEIKSNIVGAVRHGADAVSHTANQAVARATDGVKSIASNARNRATSAHDDLCDFVSERPYTTIALSALAGAVLLGVFSRRLRR